MDPNVARLEKLFIILIPVGSRRTCDPAPMDTDDDYIGLVAEGEDEGIVEDALRYDCWEQGGSEPTNGAQVNSVGQSISYTKGQANLIVTTSSEFFHRFLVATSLAKRLNLLNKKDRIALFQAVLYGNIQA